MTQHSGHVMRLVRDRGFGFIEGDNGTEYFFHRSECPDFDTLVDGPRGTRVEFKEQVHAKGSRAIGVELAG